MYILWTSKDYLKEVKSTGVGECPNCHYYTDKKLCKEKFKLSLFYILPIFACTKKKILVCPNCGEIKKLTSAEYKELKNM